MKESCDTIASYDPLQEESLDLPLWRASRTLLTNSLCMDAGRAYEFICNNMKEEPCVPDHDIGTASSQKGDCARKMAVKIMDEELVKQHPDDIHVPTTGTASAFVD